MVGQAQAWEALDPGDRLVVIPVIDPELLPRRTKSYCWAASNAASQVSAVSTRRCSDGCRGALPLPAVAGGF